ncbi:hypothetical protein AJ80_03643 [Polytolypa hystricis UAMH7299]|uniref:Uncharacterized protein n=1 Tax=Polytolypa hystricis (strain UAMH7299) TaxID=1447883 RepID=A0A2B7YGH8_POLH7|nr:hypothetical protein AJ80_03643 [Polytolypa hystricis UAMH7299]
MCRQLRPKGPQLKRWINPKTWWSALDMDLHSLLMMMKGSLPPVVVIAMHQSTAVADITVTVGYLAALVSVAAQCLLPRAMFVKIMFFNLLATCFAASLCCLACYTAIKAREHSGGAGQGQEGETSTYNSDACVVSAIWLIVVIWFANAFRAWRPMELQDPMVLVSIFSVVTLTKMGTFQNLPEGLSFISRLLKTFLLGLSIATGISLLVLPITCRGNIFKDIRRYVEKTDNVLTSLVGYVESVPSLLTGAEQTLPPSSDAAGARSKLRTAINELNALDAKIQSGLYYSKNEVAWGKLAASDLVEISGLLRNLLRPLSGMALLPEVLDNPAELDSTPEQKDENFQNNMEGCSSDPILESLRVCLSEMSTIVATGLQYFLLQLELVDRNHPRQRCGPVLSFDHLDKDGKPVNLDPSSVDSIDMLEQILNDLPSRKRVLDVIFQSYNALSQTEGSERSSDTRKRSSALQREYFLTLYMLYLQNMVVDATLALAKFAHTKVVDRTMAQHRLIYPDNFIVGTWFSPSPEPQEDSTVFSAYNQPREDNEGNKVADPQHLVPANIWERGSGYVGRVVRLVGSDLSMFGFRVSVASFCVAILAFLDQTQEFFIRQRGVWAMIVIVIGMSPTSGQSLFGFVARILSTVLAVALSLIAWYIVAGRMPGVIVFLFLANTVLFYIYVKKPRYFGPSVIAIITLNVIIGYELQVYKLGRVTAESHGQPYYPIYLFGPYKLVTVAIGCAISFFWVIFPYPITAKSKVPRLVGQSLFNLARFYAAMHTTVGLWINRQHCSQAGVAHPHSQLVATLTELYKEELFLLNSVRMYSRFSSYEPSVGGKFPNKIYGNMVTSIQRTLNMMSLMAYIGNNMPPPPSSNENVPNDANDWFSHLSVAALESTDFQSQTTASLLCHLGSAIMNGQPLPPFLSVSEPYPLARQLQRLNIEFLDVKNAQYPAFTAFVSLEVLRTMMNIELETLLE